jgi:predicted acyltransferase
MKIGQLTSASRPVAADGPIPLGAHLKNSARLTSLDAFRGLTMAAMVVVNNPGDWGHVYPPLLHSLWHGWTPADLIFPFFLFIMGVSMALSQDTMGSPWKIVRRGCIIYALGMFVTQWPRLPLGTRFPFVPWRSLGVLQRIAECYLAAAFLFRWTAPPPAGGNTGWLDRSRSIRLLWWAALLTIGISVFRMLVPPPGGMAGDLGPGQTFGAYIDRRLFRLEGWVPPRTWHPEGLVSTIPACATTLLGLITGLWLASSASRPRKAAGMAVAGGVWIVIGLVWSFWIPINKNLWTGSYVWFTGGAAALALTACYWLIDVRDCKRCWPFVVLGRNAILLFVASELLAKWMRNTRVALADGTTTSLHEQIHSYFLPLADPYTASLLFALANLAVMWILLYVMYSRGWFLKV